MSIITLDHQLFSFINQTLSNSFFDVLMPYIRNKNTWWLLYATIIFIFIKDHRKDFLLFAFFFALAMFFSDTVICNGLKNSIQRIRPCDDLLNNPHLRLLLKNCSNGFSFPSAHATNHTTFGITLGLFFRDKKKTSIYLYLLFFWAFCIAFAQVYVGVHYPIDVLAGLLFGTLNGYLFFYLYTKANSYFYKRQKQE